MPTTLLEKEEMILIRDVNLVVQKICLVKILGNQMHIFMNSNYEMATINIDYIQNDFFGILLRKYAIIFINIWIPIS